MKQFLVLFKGEMFVKRYQLLNPVLFSSLLIVPIFFSACSGKLGTIQQDDVDAQLIHAEQAIKLARDVNAPSLAFEEFEQAETYLDKAREALEENNGIDALRFATQAITHAKIAQRKAVQNTMSAELNATILEKDALIVELRKDINTKKTEITGLENGIQQLRETERDRLQTIRTLENEKQELSDARNVKEQKLAELNESLKSLQARVARSEGEVRNYGLQVKELSQKLEVAETMAKSSSKQKRAAIAEAESLKKQLREQAKIYTNMLEKAKKQNIAAEHQEYMRKTAEQARAFEKQLHSNEPKRTVRTSLSTQQINAGKATLNKWERAWNSKNIKAHLAFYSPNVAVNKIVTQESKENPSTINRSEFEAALREISAQSWQKTESFTEVEQDSVIGTYRLSRLVAPAETEDDTALYDIWFREVWVHQVQGEWKIYRETWQIYENVPKL
jgi:ketosteroid isomerase-like protein